MFKLLRESKINKERIKDLEEISSIKQKRINELNKRLYSDKKELIEDFILILEQIQETNNENLQWKKRQTIIRNEIALALENYEQKMVELKEKF